MATDSVTNRRSQWWPLPVVPQPAAAGLAGGSTGWLPGSWARGVLGAVAVAAIAVALHFGLSAAMPAMVVWAAALAVLGWWDLVAWRLPTALIRAGLALTSALLVLAAAAEGEWDRLGWALATGLGVRLLLGLWALLGQAGWGDVRLAGLIGLGVGWVSPPLAMVAVAVGCAGAAAVGLVGRAVGRFSATSRLPLGAFLAVAAVAVIVGS